MKIRNGFVSNSSSSSFIIVNPDESKLKNKIIYVELKGKTKKNVLKSIDIEVDETDKVVLTEYLNDSYDLENFLPKTGCYYYFDGGHSGPYIEEDFIEIEDDVWVLKKHYKFPKRIQKAFNNYNKIIKNGFEIFYDDFEEQLTLNDLTTNMNYKLKGEN